MSFFKKDPPQIDVYGASDFARIPMGHFLVLSGTGKRSLGYKSGNGLHWTVQRPPDLTDKLLQSIPVVKLHVPMPTPDGALRIGDRLLVDSSVLDSDSTVEWIGG